MSWGDTFRAAWCAGSGDGRFFCAQLATGEHPVGVAAPGLRLGTRPDVEGWIARTTAAQAADAAATIVRPPEDDDV